MKLKGNRKRCGEETENVSPVFPLETTMGKLFCNFHTTTKRRVIESRIVEGVVITRIFVRNFRVNMEAAMGCFSHSTYDWTWWLAVLGLTTL